MRNTGGDARRAGRRRALRAGREPHARAGRPGRHLEPQLIAKVPSRASVKTASAPFSIAGPSLGKTREDRVANLEALLGGYFVRGAQHLNVNVLTRETLIEAMNDPGKHPDLTVRVSGYAVNFNKLSVEHQREVIARTFHEAV